MAIEDFLEPSPVVPNPSGAQQEEFRKGWRDYLRDPAAQAALLSFGAQMLQPLGIGQTFLGQLGQAVGKAGEAAGTQRTAEREADEQRLRAEENEIDREYRRRALEMDAARLAQNESQFQRSLAVDDYRARNPRGSTVAADPDTVIRIRSELLRSHTDQRQELEKQRTQRIEASVATGEDIDAINKEFNEKVAALGTPESYVARGTDEAIQAGLVAQEAFQNRASADPNPTTAGRPSSFDRLADSSEAPKPAPAPATPPVAPPPAAPTFNELISLHPDALPTILANAKVNPARAREMYNAVIARASDGSSRPSYDDWIAAMGVGAVGMQ